jgi:two-component system response regulator HydG
LRWHTDTLFLDEIGNLPYDVQTLLLRVLQEKVLRRIGGNKEITVDVRIVVASNERLLELSSARKFREDLYHRLNEFQIELAPLRKRPDDIMFFAEQFLKETGKELGREINGFDDDVAEVFLNYPWPGNVRELKNVIKRAALLSTKKTVDIRSLPFEILNHAHIKFDTEETPVPIHEPKQSPVNGHAASEAHVNDIEPSLSKPGLKKAALGAEHKIILDALTKADYNKSKAAEILGVDRKTLYNKLKKMKLLDE